MVQATTDAITTLGPTQTLDMRHSAIIQAGATCIEGLDAVLLVEFNDFVDCGDYGVGGGVLGSFVYHNIFHDMGLGAIDAVGGDVQYNLMDPGDPAAGFTNLAGDPLFVTWAPSLWPAYWDTHIRVGSPAIDTGFGLQDADGSQTDMGRYGGPEGDPHYRVDADGDGAADGWELRWFATTFFGIGYDWDGDGADIGTEYANGTVPVTYDTDGDFASDGVDASPLDPTVQ